MPPNDGLTSFCSGRSTDSPAKVLCRPVQRLNLLSNYGVGFRSLAEPYLDSCGFFKDAIIAILGTIAKQERVRISERVKQDWLG